MKEGNCIISKSPPKQVSRSRKSSRRAPPSKEGAAQNGITQTQEREPVLQNQQRDNNDIGDDVPAYGEQTSLRDLFDLSEGDEHSIDSGTAASPDHIFSPKEQNEQAMDSDTKC